MKIVRRQLSILLLATVFGITGCSGGKGNEDSPGSKSSPSGSSQPSPGASSGPVVITTAKTSQSSIKFADGENYDNNSVYKAYERDLGITLKNAFVADGQQYDQKVKLAIASGEIPDLFAVGIQDLSKLVEADLVMNITDLFEKHATAKTKAFLTADGGHQLDTAKFAGKLMAIPQTSDPRIPAQYLWVRKDWLDKVGLPEPKTHQDVLKISEAFAHGDPDNNGVKDTYGIGVDNSLFSLSFGLKAFFNAYHAYPGQWIEDGSGKLVYGNIQPEMRQGLQQLQTMFKNGEIDPEFGVKDFEKTTETAAANKLGIMYGPFYAGAFPLKVAAVKGDKLVQNWRVYPIVSADDQPAKTQLEATVASYFVISKKAKHPEEIIELLNQYVLMQEDQKGVGKDYFGFNHEDTVDYWMLNPFLSSSQTMLSDWGTKIPEALKTGDTSKLNDSELNLYQNEKKYLEGNAEFWGSAHMEFSEDGTLSILNQYVRDNRLQYNKYTDAPTETMVEKLGTLEAKMLEVYSKIIMNEAPIEEFDKFVKQWESLGGDQMTREVNEWYTANKK
ncbi:extracellular solute-binding protein [Paenibacillus eucommiae]|uniref:Aldouronate transport system substrate-binding protein n=1 Tax=Paenibacillus eucommiae TaxID=1355755 RepID=A0ABS4ISU7_9BACL|nr:extracellular solute-binding protein [Paenibacillus eucommiae]MBP1990091.1 putative aldouronate transport system substrate-binding protein [Paenibacillus eucommiae]